MSTPHRTQARRSPLSYIEALRAANRPRTDEENALLHPEIACRYALQKKRRRADPMRFIPLRRIDDLELLFTDRYGLCLPDDDIVNPTPAKVVKLPRRRR